MKHHELIKQRLNALPKRSKVDKNVANYILRGTTGRIWYANGRYGWSARKATCYKFNSARAALRDITTYFEQGGY